MSLDRPPAPGATRLAPPARSSAPWLLALGVVVGCAAGCGPGVEARVEAEDPEAPSSPAEAAPARMGRRALDLDRWLAGPQPLPLVTRSPRVPRASVGAGGDVELILPAGLDPVLSSLEHADDTQVLATPDGPWLVGPPELAHVLEGTEPQWLAWQDGELPEADAYRLGGTGGATHLVLVSGADAPARVAWDGGEAELPPAPRGALVLPGNALRLTAGGSAVDQAFFVREARPVAGELEPLALTQPLPTEADGRTVRHEGRAPAAPPAGRTRTFWLDLGAGDGRFATAAASAPADPSRGAPLLRDVSRASGVREVHFEGPDLQQDIRPTMGPGAAFGDVDGDGWPDLFLVQGAGRPGAAAASGRLLRNRGDGTFEDATAGSGLEGAGGAGMGALLADLDGDGHLDLYLARYGRDGLWLGDGTGRFTDRSTLLPELELWSASVTAADPDGDGDLDLYVTSYLDYDPAKMPPVEELERYQRDDPPEMLPFAFPGQRNVFLRNDTGDDGELAWTDATEELGLLDAAGLGMQSLWWDFDGDHDPDLYVANDVSLNTLFRNEGDGTFTDVTFAVGLDDPRGGMGLAGGDVDGDGDEDLFLTNWELDTNALYVSQSRAAYGARTRRPVVRDGTVRAGLGAASIGVTSWGACLFDLELDGDLDLFVANGYTSPDYETTGVCVGQPDQLFLGDGDGRFEEVVAPGSGVTEPLASRCAVGCDVDRDGDLDLLVTANNGRARLLLSDAPRAEDARWLRVELRAPDRNTRAIGARVTVEVDGRRWSSTLRAGEGYLGGNPPELLFGLGSHPGDTTARVTVRWPDGTESVHADLALDRGHLLTRP